MLLRILNIAPCSEAEDSPESRLDLHHSRWQETTVTAADQKKTKEPLCNCQGTVKLIESGSIPEDYLSELIKQIERSPSDSRVHLALAMYYEQEGLFQSALKG